jgi:hypothetical protein
MVRRVGVHLMAWARSNVVRYVAWLIAGAIVAGAFAMNANASPVRESAVIVDSGSTNTAGYRIEVWSDGTGVVTVKSRPGSPQTEPKSFTFPTTTAGHFFTDLKAAQAANVAGAPCMKSASFGTSTHVSWNGWTSPDLDCPSDNAHVGAVIRDVDAIRSASGVGALPGVRLGPAPGGPPHVEPTASPDSST